MKHQFLLAVSERIVPMFGETTREHLFRLTRPINNAHAFNRANVPSRLSKRDFEGNLGCSVLEREFGSHALISNRAEELALALPKNALGTNICSTWHLYNLL